VQRARKENQDFIEEWLHVDDVAKVTPYVSISTNPIGIRRKPSLKEDCMIGRIVEPGSTILVDRVLEVDGIRFLKLLGEDNAWVFENTDAQTYVMAEMRHLETGLRYHRVVCSEYISIRKAPIYDAAAKSRFTMGPAELCVIDVKCQVRGWKFLRLADGRGWVFVMRPGIRKDNTELANMCLKDVDDEIVHGQQKVEFRSLLPATNKAVEVGLWTYTVISPKPVLALGARVFGAYVLPSEVVKVDKRAYDLGEDPCPGVAQVLWLHLQDLRGWVPLVDDGEELLVLGAKRHLRGGGDEGAGVSARMLKRAGSLRASLAAISSEEIVGVA